jgi:hypothetical protein
MSRNGNVSTSEGLSIAAGALAGIGDALAPGGRRSADSAPTSSLGLGDPTWYIVGAIAVAAVLYVATRK